jgi:hypothetical protein
MPSAVRWCHSHSCRIILVQISLVPHPLMQIALMHTPTRWCHSHSCRIILVQIHSCHIHSATVTHTISSRVTFTLAIPTHATVTHANVHSYHAHSCQPHSRYTLPYHILSYRAHIHTPTHTHTLTHTHMSNLRMQQFLGAAFARATHSSYTYSCLPLTHPRRHGGNRE